MKILNFPIITQFSPASYYFLHFRSKYSQHFALRHPQSTFFTWGVTAEVSHLYLLTPWCRVLLEQLTGFAASQEIPRISRNPKVHYLTHKRPPPVSILGQPNPVHIPTSYHLEILILSTHLRLGLPSGLFPSGFPTKTPYNPLSSPIRATCPTHLILLEFITHTILGEEYFALIQTILNIIYIFRQNCFED